MLNWTHAGVQVVIYLYTGMLTARGTGFALALVPDLTCCVVIYFYTRMLTSPGTGFALALAPDLAVVTSVFEFLRSDTFLYEPTLRSNLK